MLTPLLLHLYPTSMWGRCRTIVASMQLGRTPPLLAVHSLSDRLPHSPPTSSSVFLSFCFLALLCPSLSFLRTPHLFSSLARTIASCVLGTFFEISPTFKLPLIFSFVILSNLVSPHVYGHIFISATAIFFSCAFFAVRDYTGGSY